MLAKVDEMIVARRVATGSGKWTIVKNRRTNLAIGYLDVDHKSGVTMAREMKTRMQAGKCASASDMDTWMRANADKEGFVALVDDFAGDGAELVGGLKGAYEGGRRALGALRFGGASVHLPDVRVPGCHRSCQSRVPWNSRAGRSRFWRRVEGLQ